MLGLETNKLTLQCATEFWDNFGQKEACAKNKLEKDFDLLVRVR